MVSISAAVWAVVPARTLIAALISAAYILELALGLGTLATAAAPARRTPPTSVAPGPVGVISPARGPTTPTLPAITISSGMATAPTTPVARAGLPTAARLRVIRLAEATWGVANLVRPISL